MAKSEEVNQALGIEVSSFLSETMNQILQGIGDIKYWSRGPDNGTIITVDVGESDEVLFDLAVTAVASKGAKGGFKVTVPVVGVDLGASAESTHQVTNRVQFKLRVFRMSRAEANAKGVI